MKKIYSFALVVLTLLSSVIFFACGDKYKDLQMDFYSADGVVINELNLMIDNNNPEVDLSYAKVGVKISGIDEDEIGLVLIYSSTPNLIDVSNYIYDGNFVWVTVIAKNSTSSAKLMVRHLDSNQLASIDLIINKKSSGLSLVNSNNKYIVSIPTEDGVVNEHYLNRNEILTLSPTGSTDKVLYMYADMPNKPDSDEIIWEEVDGNLYVAGFNLTSGSTFGEYQFYPITFMEGYEPKPYTDKTFTVVFDKTLTEENFVLKDSKDEEIDLNEVFYLIKNDANTNSLSVQLDYSGVKEDYYTMNLKSSKTLPYNPNGDKSSLFVDDEGDNIISIQALAPTNDVEYAIISLTHPGYVGDIQTIEKVIKVKGELKADYIQTYKHGEVVDTSETINIYDYYTSGSVFGSEFSFEPKTYVDYPIYKDLQSMQIVVAPEILNIKNVNAIEDADKGYNSVYTDNKFTNLAEIQGTWKTNTNLLEITIGGRPLKFYYYASDSVCISEPITSLSKINIRYKTQEKKEGVTYTNIYLSIKVQTIYTGSLEYLNSVESVSSPISFTEKIGVQSMVLRAGSYAEGVISPIEKDFDAVYLNSKDNTTRLVFPTEIKGVEIKGAENYIDEESFIVSVVGGGNNPLKIKQGVETGEGDTSLTYNYVRAAVAATSNVISFVFNENTDLGEYTFKILQADTGFSVSFKVYVFKDATNDDVSLNLEQKDSAFSNTNADGTKLYAEYDADYIVAAGEKLKLTVTGLSNSLIKEADFIQGYDYTGYSITATGEDAKTYFEPEQDNTLELNETYLNFKKGTYINGNHYITLTVKVNILQFEDIVTPKLDDNNNPICTTLEKTIKFFIYEPLSYEDISITKPMIRYMSDYLGAYYISDSIGEVKISMAEELWNYVKIAQKPVESNYDFDDLNYNIDNGLRINWFIDNVKNVDYLNNNSTSLTLQFNRDEDNANISYYTRTITAVINQFNDEFILTCEVQVHRSIITEEVTIKSDVSTDKNGNCYINLKQGDKPYRILAESFSSLGEVDNEEYLIMVFNKSGNGMQNAVDINNNDLSLTVNEAASGLKLVVFAKDALKQFTSSSDSGFDNPANKLVDFGNHKNAYVVIDLIISDGKTKETAFIIDSADSFWNQVVDIDYSKFTNEEIELGAPFFKVLNNINLQNTSYTGSRIVENFKGTIFTDGENYKIYGLNLDNAYKNLFTELDGNIKNLTFIVNYAYNNLSGDNTYLGVIDKNNGTLENVGCEISGEASFVSSSAIYFGGLVGENLGTIIYTDENKQSIGSVGEIELNDVEGDAATVCFGGLVGKNTGTITGYEMEPSNLGGGKVDFSVSIGSIGLMSDIVIYSNLTNENSAVGGVIGLNSGTLTNAEVGGTIISTLTNNVGGVIGKNEQTEALTIAVGYNSNNSYVTSVTDFSSSAQISNIKSHAIVSGNNNVGGVVGSDINGAYSNIKYQVLADTDIAITGNENVAGIAGCSTNGKFIFCSVMSYKWDYEQVKANLNYSTNVVDIKGNKNVAGLVGLTNTGAELDGGNNEIANSVIIYNCSVNASIEEKLDYNYSIGGILTGEKSIIYNAYFIGKLTGDFACSNYSSDIIYTDFYLENIVDVTKQSYVNNVYSIVNVDGVNKIGAISKNSNSDNSDLTINGIPNLNYWLYDADLNGGYIYVVDYQPSNYVYDASTWEEDRKMLFYLDDGKYSNAKDTDYVSTREYYIANPIFDIAPTSIEVATKESDYKVNTDTIWLNYFNFTDSSAGIISNEKLTELINKNNEIGDSLKELFNFTITPSVNARLKVSSSRPDILQVTNDAKLIVKGVGECLLTFTSVLNSAVTDTIKVIITYPVGNTVQIVDNITGNSAEITTQDISKDSGRLYSVISTGYIEERGVKYYYETNSNINLNVEISYTGEKEELIVYKQYVYNEEVWATDYVEQTKVLYIKNGNAYDILDWDDATEQDAKDKKYFLAEYLIGNILNVSGLPLTEVEDKQAKIDVLYTRPFSISVKERVNSSFNFVIKPYIEVKNADLGIDVTKNVTWVDPDKDSIAFTVTTQEGASDVSLSYSKAILYPNDSTIINAYIRTDKQLTREEINSLITKINTKNADKADDLIKLFNSKGEQIDNNFVTLKFFEDYGYKNGVHTIQFEVVINESVCINADKSEEKRELTIGVQVKTGVIAYAKYVILPQRINSIEIKNYLQDGTNYVPSNVLRQDKAGLLTLDIAPINGYFDYLEIVDVSGGEEIFFTQLTAKDGVTLPSMDKPATIGKGIQLIKNYTGYSNRLYIRTQVDSRYSSKPHTIKVYAFLSDGTLLTPGGFEFDIDVKMLPNITAEYRLPSGAVGKTATTEIGSSYDKQESFNLAVGTDAEFYITTRESDGIVVPKISAGWEGVYEFKQDNGNFYKLEFVGNPADFASYLGKDLVLTLETYQQTEIGYEVANIEFTITMQHFVVHGISLSNTIDGNGITQVYGNINQEVELEAYFKPTDISYYYNGEYNNVPYMFDNLIAAPNTTKSETLKPINYINDILRTINSNPNSYLELKHTPKMETGYFDNDGSIITDRNIVSESLKTEIEKSLDYATLTDGVLKVTNEDYNKFYNWELVVNFKLKEVNNNFVVDDTGAIEIEKAYSLSFVSATSPYEPKLIKNEEDFYAMTTGYYILGADLILDNYTPLEIVTPQNEGDPQLIEFDGNGRTITITRFNTNEFTDANLTVGLFKNIPSGTTIKNLTVKYLSVSDRAENYSLGQVSSSRTVNDFVINSYFDLCKNTNVNYVSATFGGIAATNSGVITNCNVMGEVALRATTVEEKKFYSGDKYEISFYMGGIVATNESSGYITNSNSALRIFSQANIGGFVYENKGVIASSAVDDLTDYSLTDAEISDLSNGRFEHNEKTYKANSSKVYQPLVYNYNSTLSKTVWVDLGGFAVKNSGKISMSYAKYKKTALNTGNYIGNLSAKDISAGFVNTNSGRISDTYVNIEIAGNNSNAFYGFVYQNTGTISYSYSYVNAGKKDNNTTMFALANTSGLENCVEIVAKDNSYTENSSVGLYTIGTNVSSLREQYEQHNFAFGDNKSAVWLAVAGNLPTLVSTNEKVVYTKNENPQHILDTPEKKITYYYGLKQITVTTEYTFVDGSYTETTTETTDDSSYGTKNNPIIITNRINKLSATNSISDWELYFTNLNANKYFRIVQDIDFSVVQNNPTTCNLTFSGNIQGNNMNLNNIMLYTTTSADSIGLFKEIIATNDYTMNYAIRNLTLTPTSVWASKVQSVGLLAGVIENYNLYNIDVNATNVVLVGGNAVGGIAGIVRGNFNLQRLSSNVGVNSTRATSSNKYSIYMSTNNNVEVSHNLANVYYAGSVIGILDGYNSQDYKINDNRDLSKTYFKVKDVKVTGNISVLADTAGAAFGFVGECVWVDDVVVDLQNARIAGEQYSSGAVGENRGVVTNVVVEIESDAVFNNSPYVSAGVVGFNLGGLVQHTTANYVSVRLTGTNVTLGGIVGRNIYGTITDSTFTGKMLAYFTGGIVGSNYQTASLKNVVSGSGAIYSECYSALPENNITYTYIDEKGTTQSVKNLENTAISMDTLAYFLNNLNKFYTIRDLEEFKDSVVYNKVLGLCIGATDYYDISLIQNYGIDSNKQLLMFNAAGKTCDSVGVLSRVVGTKEVDKEDGSGGKEIVDMIQTWPVANIITSPITYKDGEQTKTISGTYLTYIIGAETKTFDAWDKQSYGPDRLVFTDGVGVTIIDPPTE